MYQFEITLFAIFALGLLTSWHFKERMRQLFLYKKHSPYNFKLLIASGLLIVVCPCGRIMTTKVSHAQDAFAPVYVTVMYAPANRRDRFLFLDNMAQNRAPLLPICNHRHILLGDFNYTYATYPPSSPPRQAPIPWLSFVDAQLQECVTDLDCAPEITFSKSAARSCIDYVFGSLDL
ncbi:hypothetical protein G6F60_011929 [Rhizopus arrhizus]|uniref:Endonuclease/exonuclease/phosphatase domain-containing protein n=1 Tax=Rhizopus oryzae TaxID=64495 RepID=A0A9P6WYP5_RHIOR|nr:hypothetical protein G6F20_012102 [Rhizopus arrhizus]KAG1301257.1 hypothetical protein G6F64_011969 [Rhizopus arrhizus]KAG1392680.1 hypothetical protein G6F60_011929 [Rhizopus arrhizus]